MARSEHGVVSTSTSPAPNGVMMRAEICTVVRTSAAVAITALTLGACSKPHSEASPPTARGSAAASATTSPAASATTSPVAASSSAISAGQRVEIEWQGDWYQADVLEIDGERYRIHYLGYGANWDEWVTASRLRKPCESCPKKMGAIELPKGVTKMHQDARPGFHGASHEYRWYLSPMTEAEVFAYFVEQKGATQQSESTFTFDSGWRLAILPLEPIPKTSPPALRPVVERVPAGYKSWIVFTLDRPPPPCEPCPPGSKRHSGFTCDCVTEPPPP